MINIKRKFLPKLRFEPQISSSLAWCSDPAVSMGAAPKLCTVHESRLGVNGSTGIVAVA